MRARIAANDRWAQTADRTAATAAARAALDAKFERQVDPGGTLPPDERARRAQNARKAHYSRLALASARSRRRARESVADAEVAEAELATLSGAPPGEAAIPASSGGSTRAEAASRSRAVREAS